ncbi:SprT-like domain-containing protein [Burkholderia territorii]|nr:SprT-like domain-containing protein [Burkholderia territorii]
MSGVLQALRPNPGPDRVEKDLSVATSRLALKPRQRDALLAWVSAAAGSDGGVNLMDWPGWREVATAGETPTEQIYRDLQYAFDFYNKHLFDNTLPQCIVTLQRRKSTLGYYSRGRFVSKDGTTLIDELAMNPEYFATMPLLDILQTVVHEQVHLWQDHFGTPSRACYHNTEWADKMESVGLMPSDTGYPGGKRTGQKMDDYMIAGGRFEQATRQLLKTGFGLSWFDRFPVPVPHTRYSEVIGNRSEKGLAVAAQSDDSEDSEAADPLHTDDALGAGEHTCTARESATANAAIDVPASTQADISSAGNEDFLALACRKPMQSNVDSQVAKPRGSGGVRCKFVCVVCDQSAYGKPTLRILCALCGNPMGVGE